MNLKVISHSFSKIVFLLSALMLFASCELKNRQKEQLIEKGLQLVESQSASSSAASTPSSHTSKLPSGVEIPRYESSRGGQVIRHTGFTLSYDSDYKTPQWVAWELTADEVDGNCPRKKSFSPDPEVRGAKSYHKDYSNSGYDRGHMAPAADMKWSEKAMEESFYTSNICPQNQNLNRGDWKDLEEQEREWAKRYGAVAITAGPIYKSKTPERIGAHHVAVPDAFFKVLLVGYPDNPKAYGFVFRNEAGTRRLTYYQKTVDEVETITGMDFFHELPDDVENKIESISPQL